MAATSTSDPLAFAADEPDLDNLLEDFERSGVTAQYQTNINEETRLCEWEGQADDGRKHREKLNDDPFPWEGASDMRPFLTDHVQRLLINACLAAFERGNLRCNPTEASDTELAGKIQQALHFYRNRNRKELRKEAELLLNYLTTHGSAAWQTGWERSVSMRQREVDMESLVTLAAQSPEGSLMAELPAIFQDPEREIEALGIVRALVPDLTTDALARKVVRSLRETGSAKIPQTFTTYHGPRANGLRVAHEILFPPETADLSRSRVIFRRDWMSETELRAKVKTDGWNEKWVEQVLSTRGQTSSWNSTDWLMQGAKREWSQYSSIETQDNLVEVVWAYTRQIDEYGCPGIYLTIFNPHQTKAAKAAEGKLLYALHNHLEEALGEYPFVDAVMERLTRRITSARGVPDITHTWQNEEKTQRDMLSDRAALEINPPFRTGKNLSQVRELRPGSQVVGRANELERLDPPKGSPALAFDILAVVRHKAAEYFNLPHPDVMPEQWQLGLQTFVEGWLISCEAMYAQWGRLLMNPEVMDDAELSRITGVEFAPGERSVEAAARGLDFTIQFDVRALSMDQMTKKLEAVASIIAPLDRAGRIDHFKLVEMMVANVDPSLAQALQGDQRAAEEKIREEVDTQVARMALGNEASYTESDPTAGLKMQFLQEILQSNPKYAQAIQSDEHFQGLVQNYLKNLQQSIVQMGANRQTGRTGVKQMQ